MWQFFAEPTLSSRLCLMLLHSLWQATLFALAAGAVARLWRRRSVERDYGFQVVALLASLVAMPVTFASVSVVRPHAAEELPSSSPAGVASAESDGLRLSSVSLDAPRTPLSTRNASRFGAPASPDAHRESAWLPLAPWIAALYGLGVVLMLARLAAGVWQASRLGRRGQILRDGPFVELVRTMAAKWSMSVVPVLVRADEIFVPKVVGLIWPKILLPASALTGLSAAELEMILRHELAHLRRHDMWVNLLQRLAEAVLFFNPAAWYLTRRISTLRECCCDELTCRSLAPDARSRTEYALALLRVAELARDALQQAGNGRSIGHQELVALSASGRSPSQLRLRLASLLGEPVREPLRLSAGGMVTVTALAHGVAVRSRLLEVRGEFRSSGIQTAGGKANRLEKRAILSRKRQAKNGGCDRRNGRHGSAQHFGAGARRQGQTDRRREDLHRVTARGLETHRRDDDRCLGSLSLPKFPAAA